MFHSDKIPEHKIRTSMEWNQTFTFTLTTGLEKIDINLVMTSVALGKVKVDSLVIDLETVLPKLGD